MFHLLYLIPAGLSPDVLLLFMTPITPHQNTLSSAESRRQLDESIERAMDRYRSDFEAVRENSARLRAVREERDREAAATAATKTTAKRRSKA